MWDMMVLLEMRQRKERPEESFYKHLYRICDKSLTVGCSLLGTNNALS